MKKILHITAYVFITVILIIGIGFALAGPPLSEEAKNRMAKSQCDGWFTYQRVGGYLWAPWQMDKCEKQGMKFDRSKNSNQLKI